MHVQVVIVAVIKVCDNKVLISFRNAKFRQLHYLE